MSENTFVIIDNSNLIYRSAYGNQNLATKAGKFSGHIFGMAASLFAYMRNELKDLNCKFVFCYDGISAKDYRRSLYPEYKGNRSKHEFDPMPEGTEFLRLWPGLHIEQDNMEGDDAMAFAVHMRQGKPCIVISGDKDIWGLMKYPNCRVLSPNLKRFVEDVDIIKEYHLVNHPERIYLAKALFGDTSDNIKGIDRLIKKQFDEVLNAPEVETPVQFYSSLNPTDFTKKTWEKLQSGVDRVALNYKIVQPRLGFDKSSVKQVGPENWQLVKQKLVEYECFSLLGQVPN